jgi:RNA polymerase sigma-70 factor (ECF subfamily)
MGLQQFLDGLVVQATSGDVAAFEQLLVHCHDRLLRQIKRGIPLDYERHFDASDVLQETFRKALESLPDLRATTFAQFQSWIEQIARHQLHNARERVRAQKRGGGRAGVALPHSDSDATAAGLLQLLARNSKSPRSIAGDKEFLLLVRSALADLDPQQQEVIRLRFIDQLRHTDIAARIGRTEDAVKMLCFRTIKQLRSLLPSASAWDR